MADTLEVRQLFPQWYHKIHMVESILYAIIKGYYKGSKYFVHTITQKKAIKDYFRSTDQYFSVIIDLF